MFDDCWSLFVVWLMLLFVGWLIVCLWFGVCLRLRVVVACCDLFVVVSLSYGCCRLLFVV